MIGTVVILIVSHALVLVFGAVGATIVLMEKRSQDRISKLLDREETK